MPIYHHHACHHYDYHHKTTHTVRNRKTSQPLFPMAVLGIGANDYRLTVLSYGSSIRLVPDETAAGLI